MSEMSLEDFAQVYGGERPAPAASEPSLARIDPAVQQQRDVEAARIRQAELQPGGGGMIPTSAVVLGSKAGTPARSLGLEAFAKTYGKPGEAGTGFGIPLPTLSGFKTAVGNAAALGDMVLGLPAQLIGVGADIGARAYGLGAGVSRREAAQAGQEGRNIAEPLANPLQKLMTAVGYGDSYDKSHVAGALQTLSSWLDKGGDWIEKRTGGALLKEDVGSLVNTIMAAGGVAGVKGAADFLRQKPGEAAMRRGPRPEDEPPGPSYEGNVRAVEGEVLPAESPVASSVPARIAGELPPPREPGTLPSQQLRLKGPAVKEIAPELKSDLLRDAQGEVIRQRQELDGLKAEEEKLQMNPGADINARRADLEFKRSIAQERLGNLMSNLTRLGGEIPPWAKTLGIGAAAYAAVEKSGHGDEGLVALGLLGAMKAKGGMWHPKAAETVALPLKMRLANVVGEERMTFDQVEAAKEPLMKWADKSASSYLNKHMGTETDPLKDIEIPFGEGTKKWGEVTEALVNNSRAAATEDLPLTMQKDVASGKIPWQEPIWNLKGDFEAPAMLEGAPAKALKSYLSHVGDYLRQNVEPSKLPQYDLVRAVKETAKNDAEMAKKMEKEVADATAELPVHKAYPDGFKWVELKLPEKLSEGQAKTIRYPTKEEWNHLQDTDATFEQRIRNSQLPLIATDAAGKPIKNSYTENFAAGITPEEAWLSGQLAREGNQMGHCFPAGTLVMGPQCNLIERIAVGDEVFTHTGATHRVTQLFERTFKGDLLEVATRGALPFSCTPEHPILVVRPHSTGSHWQDRFIAKRMPETLLPQWLPAKQLQLGDYVLTKGLTSQEPNEELDDLVWLMGLYAGDGDAAGGTGVGLTLSPSDDVERVERTFKALGYRPRFRDKENYYRVRVNSQELSRQFKDWFGNSSQEKHLPAFLFAGDANLKEALAGLTEADGTFYDGRWRLTSTSIALAQQAWLIAVTLGYRPSIKTLKRKPGQGYANASPAWVVEWKEEKGKWHANIRWNEYYATPIVGLEKQAFSGQVYNIEVEEDHSYLVNGLAVHNCVGGYCEGVASGESRIFSLRDPKGKSHVTIEVAPRTDSWSGEHTRLAEQYARERGYVPPGPEGPLWEAQDVARIPEGLSQDILQIKGKQNRAPASTYLPYVQDFVRGGKWGEVGDLDYSGLERGADYNPEVQQRLKELYGEQTYHTHEEINAALPKSPGGFESGSISPELLRTLTAAGAGTLLGVYLDDSNLRGAILGALAGTGLGVLRPGRGGLLTTLDEVLGRPSTRLGNIDPSLTRRARDYEFRVLRDTAQAYDQVIPFIKATDKLPPEAFRQLDMAYMRNDAEALRTVLSTHPELRKSYAQVRKVLDGFRAQFQNLKRFREGLSDYLPLVVKDFEGLKASLGQEVRTGLEKIMLESEAEMIRTRGRGLSEVEQSIITNRYLKSKETTSGLPGFAKEREMLVTEATRPFYASMKESLLRYVSAATQDIEAARFFGRDLKTSASGGKRYTNVDDSIGALVARQMREGKMTPDQALQVRDILRARFGPGEQAPSGFIQDLRNTSNLALLGQFSSAATQVGDSVMTVFHHGLRPTLEALVLKLARRGVSPADFGLVNHIAEEFTSNRLSGRALTNALRATSFSAIDRFAKGLNLTAALRKNQRAVQSPSGLRRLEEKWGATYGEDFPRLVAELKAGRRTPTVDSLLFGELSNAQPISKIEMPQAYLEHPDGRLLYQMKGYMLTQADVIRREVYNEVKKGTTRSVARGLKNAAAFAAVLSLSNVPGDIIKDWLSGRPLDLKIDWVENLLQNFGINRYSLSEARKGKPVEVARDVVLPPYKHYQDLLKMDKSSVKYLPPAGRIYYDRKLGGNEKKQRAKERAEKQREQP